MWAAATRPAAGGRHVSPNIQSGLKRLSMGIELPKPDQIDLK